MSVPEASETPPFPPLVRDLSTDPASVPLPQPDDLKAVLDAETVTHAAIFTIIRDCERQLDELSTSLPPQDPTIRDLRHTLNHALIEASQSKIRQANLRMQLRIVSGHQRRLEGKVSGLGLAIDRFLEARDETLRMGFAASAHLFDGVATGARTVVRQVISVCQGMLGLGVKIGWAWSEVWEQLRANLAKEEKDDEDNWEGGKAKEEKARTEQAEGKPGDE